MLVRDVQKEIEWLETAIAETQKRIEWNETHRWFSVVDGEWRDVTDERNDLLRAEVAKCHVMLDHNREKATQL